MEIEISYKDWYGLIMIRIIKEFIYCRKRRYELRDLIHTNLHYATSTEKLRWIMDANGWKDENDVFEQATDRQVEAFFRVWGLEAYVP